MADSLKTHLLTTRRRIPLDRAEEYDRLWRDVRRAVESAGGRAWLFRSDHASDYFIEFVEWRSEPAHRLIERDDVADALKALSAAFISRDSETWIETTI